VAQLGPVWPLQIYSNCPGAARAHLAAPVRTPMDANKV